MKIMNRLKRVVYRTPSLSSRSLSNVPKPAATGSSHDQAVFDWLTSPLGVASPPVSTQFWISWRNGCFTASTQSRTVKLDNPVVPIGKLLLPLTNPTAQLLRSPATRLPPLHVEYSSPNIAKPLHMGHLRSTITGKFIKNVAEFAGHQCKSVCFLGDWGRQFGVLHAGVRRRNSGKPLQESIIEGLSLQELLKIYVESTGLCETDPEFLQEALKCSAMLECGDPEGKALWAHTRRITVDHLKSCYSNLEIHFDRFEGESEYQRDSESTLRALQMLEHLITKTEDGATRIKLDQDNDQILLKRDNSSVYLLRDIACALDRIQREPPNSKFVYVVDNAQYSYFKNLFQALSLLGVSSSENTSTPFKSTHTHVGFGRVKGMSTRSGNFVLLSDVLDVGTRLMHESRKNSRNARNLDDMKVSEKLAVSGLVVNALKVRRNKDYSFDWDEALKSKGNTGVALQYGMARLRSLLDKLRDATAGDDMQEGHEIEVLLKCSDDAALMELIACLANFEDTFWRSYMTLEPCTLIAYAFNLNDKISRSLASVNVLKNPDPKVQAAYAWVYTVSRLVLENCLRVVGVPILDKGF